MAFETFTTFILDDPHTTELPGAIASADRFAIVRPSAGTTYWVSAVQAFQVPGVTTVTPSSGNTVELGGPGPYFVNTAALAALTIMLPADPISGWTSEICFLAPVTTLAVVDADSVAVATAPTSAFGPGSAIVFKYVSDAVGWAYWK
jgi:hypothetical protein